MAPSPPDLVEDLDDAPAPEGADEPVPAAGARRTRRTPSWPEGTPAWVRSPLGALVAAVLGAALVGGAGVHQVRVQSAADRALDRDLAQVRVGPPMIAFNGVAPAEDQRGHHRIQVQVPLVNGTDRKTEITVLGFSGEQLVLVDAPEPLDLGPGSRRTLDVAVEVDCADVAPPPTSGVPASEEAAWVDVVVEGLGERRQERRVVEVGLVEQLPWACDPMTGSSRVSASLVVQDDGRLLALVSNSGDEPAAVGLEADSALGVSSDVELPVTVPAGGTRPVTLALSPDCARAGGGLGRQLDVVDVQPADGGESWSVLSDQVLTAAWVARQVALACG